jgi:hypothetical protein
LIKGQLARHAQLVTQLGLSSSSSEKDGNRKQQQQQQQKQTNKQTS